MQGLISLLLPAFLFLFCKIVLLRRAYKSISTYNEQTLDYLLRYSPSHENYFHSTKSVSTWKRDSIDLSIQYYVCIF